MQNYKLEDLIKDIEVPKELKDTTIFKTDANSERRSMEVTLVSYDLVPYDIIEEYKKTVCLRYGLSEFILRIREPFYRRYRYRCVLQKPCFLC